MLSNAIVPRELHLAPVIRIAAAILIMLEMVGSTHAASPYCVPKADGTDRIRRTQSSCPVEYFATGNCCEALHRGTKKAMPKMKGAACPSGWFASGKFCEKIR
jgi:hypothetical protein